MPDQTDTSTAPATDTQANPETTATPDTTKQVDLTPPVETPPVVTDHWYDQLSEDLKNNPTIQKYKSNEDQMKAHLELTTLLGHDKVAIPKDAEDTIAREKFNEAIGVPKEFEGYKLEDPAPLPGMEVMFDINQFKQLAHKHDFTPAQAQGVLNDYRDMLASIQENAKTEHTANVTQAKTDLSKEWGLAYETKVKLAQSVMNKFAGEGFEYVNGAIGADPTFLKMFAAIGEKFGEGTIGDLPGTTSSRFTMTPQEAKAAYETIMNDSTDNYWAGVRNKNIVSETARKERVSYVEDLLKQMQPGIPT